MILFTTRFKPNGEEIIENPKYFINTSATSTILKIISLSVMDTGNYTLEAKNDYMIEKLNFTLDVLGIEICSYVIKLKRLQ